MRKASHLFREVTGPAKSPGLPRRETLVWVCCLSAAAVFLAVWIGTTTGLMGNINRLIALSLVCALLVAAGFALGRRSGLLILGMGLLGLLLLFAWLFYLLSY